MKTNKNFIKRIVLTILFLISIMVAFPQKSEVCKPTTSFGKYKGTCTIPKNELLVIKSITCVCENVAGISVVSFDLTVITKGQTNVVTCSGSELSSDAQKLINGTQAGSKVFIDVVKVKYSDSTLGKASGITLTVK